MNGNGAVKYSLASVDGATGKGTITLDVALADLLNLDGYINVYLLDAQGQPGAVVANGEVGLNAVPVGGDSVAKPTR